MTLQQSPTILIVDHIPENVSNLLLFMSINSFQVLVAGNSESALKIVDSAHPQLILIDIVLVQDDHDFVMCKQLKSNSYMQDIPLIFMLDNPNDLEKFQNINIGIVEYVQKPFQFTELLARINNLIKLSQLQETITQQSQEIEANNEQVDILTKKLAEEGREKSSHKSQLLQLNQAYKRFVPEEFLKFLGKDSVTDVQLGDLVEKEMTVLFSDIRDFSILSRDMNAEEQFDFINIYLGQMEPVITQHHGLIDKYMGDGIMALYPTCADDALQGAIAMLKKLVEYNELLQEAGYPSISIGIGLNTGNLILGTIGGKNRMDGTVISAAVSLASKIEEMTRVYSTPLLITENTFNELKDESQYNIRVIDRAKVKGANESVMVFEVFDADPPEWIELKIRTLADFEEGCAAYHSKQYEEARKHFEKVLAVNPNDKAAQAYNERCKTPEELEVARQKFMNELFELNKAYERFIPRDFIRLLDKESVVDVQLGDHVEKEMTILFCDIRGFTAMSEKMTPQENFDFINIYLGQMEPIIDKYGGFIDKYIGDAIMALFVSADAAVLGAISMLQGLVEYNELLSEAHYQEIKIGIGLNTGPLMLGTIGGPNRMDGTVISDAVNLAARVEGLTKTYGTALLITDQTYQKLEDISKYHIRVVDRVTVKGKTEPVTVYEIFDGNPTDIIELKAKTLEDFEMGCVYYHGEELHEAQQCFERVLSIYPDDEAAQVYLQRCLDWKEGEHVL